MPAVEAEAKRRGVELGSADQASLPTPVFGKTWGEFCDIAGDVLIALFGLRQP
jgi:hypothetical protein